MRLHSGSPGVGVEDECGGEGKQLVEIVDDDVGSAVEQLFDADAAVDPDDETEVTIAPGLHARVRVFDHDALLAVEARGAARRRVGVG